MMMTNSTQDFFRNNPWELIGKPIYPNGRRLYLNDERFWVSMDDSQQILFFIQDKGVDKIKPLENLAGLKVSIEKHENGDERLVCRLTSQDPELVEKFATVAKDVAYYCSAYKGQQLFIKTQERIKSWANFLKPSRSGLTHSEFSGIFGELYVLAEHMMPILSALDAVRAWIGPDNKKQDFTLNQSSIEVKTTLSGDPQSLTISSLDQLDRISNKLFLMRIVAAPSGEGCGLSLAGLYKLCIEAIAHDFFAEVLFLQKISSLYSIASESQLKECFSIVDVSYFEVNDRFPKLTRSDVSLGILDVKYDIAIAAIRDFKVVTSVEQIVSNG